MMLFPTFSDTDTCKALYAQTEKSRWEYFVQDPTDAEMILVGWGDGWMLASMRTYHEFALPFFGINCGTLWFLTNKHCSDCIHKINQWDLDLVPVTAIDLEIVDVDGNNHTGFARNDITIWGSVLDYSYFDLEIWDQKTHIAGTGVVISTALGSTAYTANLWAPIIPLGSSLRNISGIATGERKYSYQEAQEISIWVQSRTPVHVWLDGTNQIIQNISKITLRPSSYQATLAFLTSENFAERRLLLAEKKLGR